MEAKISFCSNDSNDCVYSSGSSIKVGLGEKFRIKLQADDSSARLEPGEAYLIGTGTLVYLVRYENYTETAGEIVYVVAIPVFPFPGT